MNRARPMAARLKSATFSEICGEIIQKHCSLVSERKDLAKFRTGNHKLRIETGRYDQIPDYTLFVLVNLIKLKTNLIFLYTPINTLI